MDTPKKIRFTQNRELSWLKFNERVLAEGSDPAVPLFERLKFVSIFTSNLDEFFMIRVGSLGDLNLLKKPPIDNKSHMSPGEQLDAIFEACRPLYEQRDALLAEIEQQLEPFGVVRCPYDADRKFIDRWAENYVLPVLSPQIIDPLHPFPHLVNGMLYIAIGLRHQKTGESLIGIIPVPQTLPRMLFLPGFKHGYILIEEIIYRYAEQIFQMYTPVDKGIIKVTRNADINPDAEVYDDDLNYRAHMKKILKKRTRLAPVRLEVQHDLSDETVGMLIKNLKLAPEQVFRSAAPLDLSYAYELADRHIKDVAGKLFYKPFVPQPTARCDLSRPMREQVEEKDRLLVFPYESIDPFLRLMREAAHDPQVTSIKITLYRLDHTSHLAEYLIHAAENGKEVTVLMELRARFDEANNIEWAERFEEAGCNVLYGFEGYKVHSKICLITYDLGGSIHRIVQLSTGNYNEKTARLYSDIMLMTANPDIGRDAATFFRNMQIGNLEGTYDHLRVAPVSLRRAVIDGIDRAIEQTRSGKTARLIFKMNSLTDLVIIDKLIEASRAGVKVDLIIRGICCLLPGIPGISDNITVRSIVGRFLEHARIYCFLNSIDDMTLYLSSADLMTRNTEHRVEIAFPIVTDEVKAHILHFLDVQLKDDVKARILQSDGTYRMLPAPDDGQGIECQQVFMDEAIANLREQAKLLRPLTGQPRETQIAEEDVAPAELAKTMAVETA